MDEIFKIRQSKKDWFTKEIFKGVCVTGLGVPWAGLSGLRKPAASCAQDVKERTAHSKSVGGRNCISAGAAHSRQASGRSHETREHIWPHSAHFHPLSTWWGSDWLNQPKAKANSPWGRVEAQVWKEALEKAREDIWPAPQCGYRHPLRKPAALLWGHWNLPISWALRESYTYASCQATNTLSPPLIRSPVAWKDSPDVIIIQNSRMHCYVLLIFHILKLLGRPIMKVNPPVKGSIVVWVWWTIMAIDTSHCTKQYGKLKAPHRG